MSELKHLRVPMKEDELEQVYGLALDAECKSAAEYIRALIAADSKQRGKPIQFRVENRGWRSDLHPELKSPA